MSKTNPVGDDYLSLLQEFRNNSTEYACPTYDTRMNIIKKV